MGSCKEVYDGKLWGSVWSEVLMKCMKWNIKEVYEVKL